MKCGKSRSAPIPLPAIERHSLVAWPGLTQRRIGDWVLTFGGGHTKRANSASLQGENPIAPIESVAAIVEAYQREGLPAIFRITPPAVEAGVDDHLNSQKFLAFDETRVQTLDLDAISGGDDGDVTLVRVADPTFRRELAAAQGLSPDSARLQGAILDRIDAETIYARATLQGEAVAWGVGVNSGGVLGLFNIVTSTAHRGQGFGGRLVRAILAGGKQSGAREAYLQVGAGNDAALGLYARIGFRDLYRYHYRRVG